MDATYDAMIAAGKDGHVRDSIMLQEYLMFWETQLDTVGKATWEGRTAFDVNGAAYVFEGLHYPRFATDESGVWRWKCARGSEHAAGW